MNTSIFDRILDIYDYLFNTSIVDVDKLTIETTENIEHFGSLSEMVDYMLEDIYLSLENIL